MPIVRNPFIRDVDGPMTRQKAGFKCANLINAQENALAGWKRFLSNNVGTQKSRIWRISRGKSMLKRITNAISCSRQTLEDEDIITLEIEWTGLIDVGNYLSGIKGMKVGSNETCCNKIDHGMAICEKPAYQTKRLIKLIAKMEWMG